ncbi:MAG: alpha/beta hydrolase [Rhodospirillales bacterium]|nr:alpha/beta hydrolase [Rhodospirillales bacterium]MBO6786964.1 alpha/beta hydrolase [Rhodospirillales bacterium]
MAFEYLTAAGKRLEYTWVHRAPAAGEAVLVFLHEGLGCIAMWRDFPANLAAACDMPGLVYSRAGYGGSDGIDLPRPITYQEDEARDALTGVLDTLGIEKAILIGHSDGGTIALIHAGLDDTGRVLGAATMAAHVFNEEICLEGIREARQVWQTTDLRDKLMRYHGDNVDTAFFGWNDTWQRDDYWHWNVEKYLPSITCPLLVMQGKDDHYGSEDQVDAIVKGAGGPAEKLMIADCGHNPHFDQPDVTIRAICRFVQVLNDTAADGR